MGWKRVFHEDEFYGMSAGDMLVSRDRSGLKLQLRGGCSLFNIPLAPLVPVVQVIEDDDTRAIVIAGHVAEEFFNTCRDAFIDLNIDDHQRKQLRKKKRTVAIHRDNELQYDAAAFTQADVADFLAGTREGF